MRWWHILAGTARTGGADQYTGMDVMRERMWGRLAGGWAPWAILWGLAGCDSQPLAMGDVNSIVVTASEELWSGVEARVVPALERTVFTVRDEKTFKVTHHAPYDGAWYRLNLLKQQLVVGRESDPWISEVLAHRVEPVEPPAVVQVKDVWARSQLVTAAVLDDAGDASGQLEELLPALTDLFDRQYRQWAVARMTATGSDTALARRLGEEEGFTLLVPNVYDHRDLGDAHLFRNDNPDPSELIRQFTVTWRSLGDPALEHAFGPDELLAWRARVVEERYDFPQVVNRGREIVRDVTSRGEPGLSVQAVWENPPDAFPAAGPLIAQSLICPGQARRYLIDAWLYAPGREKYEYMIQLDEILSSFACVGA